ncbi:MAG: MraY family glycosyltransferase [Candidatus Babeliales bacterium]|nr:MraY family glycosyltransferase [Candidatus Babeliales bacterium]
MISFSIYTSLLVTFLISFFVTCLLVPILRKCAFRLKIVDAPDGKLKVHEKVTPYLGGVAIYLAIILTLLLRFQYNNDTLILMISVSLLMLLGLVDDIYAIKPLLKFSGQILSLILLGATNFYFKDLIFNKYLTFTLNLFWNLSIINAFNLIDVMDGLCTTAAITSTIAFVVVSLIFNQISVAILLTAFLGSLVSFLIFNFPAAKIYLGDSGSMFIGGFLGLIPFLLNWSSLHIAITSSCILLIIPILELVSLIAIRSYKRIPFYMGSPDHFSIYLRLKGWSKKKVLLYVAFVNILVALIVLLNILNYISLLSVMLLISIIVGLWFLIICF